MSLRAVGTPGESPWPNSAGRRILFLVDASGSLERRLADDWIRRHRPAEANYQVVGMPGSRRRRRGESLTAVQSALDQSDATLAVPLRVVWAVRRRRGRRVPSLFDLITLGDPRDPNRLLQELIVRLRPEQVTVVAGVAATVSDLRQNWQEDRAQHTASPSGFAEFVALRAALTLEVTERRLRGNRYKVSRFVAEDLLGSASFQAGLAEVAARSGDEAAEVSARAAKYLNEIAASPSTFVIDLMAALVRHVYTMGYERRIRYDQDALDRIAALGQSHSLAFLPSHKSNMDHLALTYLLYENGLPPNHTAGGINMKFFPIGGLLRRHGIFFIRRSFKDDEVYKFVLKRYLDYLLARRFPLEWYLEGGRSRTGKLREPKFGMLSYVADSWRRGSCDDVVLVPTSIAYDQIQDVGAHAAEQRGAAKERESLAWMVRVIRSLRRRYGRIHVAFGEPIHLAQALERYPAGHEPDPEAAHLEIAKLAFEVSVRINRVTPITPISLVTMALLGRDRAVTAEETHVMLRDFITFVEARGLPVTEHLELDDPEVVRAALDALVEHKVVSRWDGGTATVYAIATDKEHSAAYYRNTIAHFFTAGAIAEVALLAADDGDEFWGEVAALRDLLKFELFFAEKEEFRAEVAAEVAYHDPDWELHLGSGDAASALRRFRPFTAHRVLRPVFEAYLLVAETLAMRDFRSDVEPKSLIADALALGGQYRAQRRIKSPEAVSTVLFESAVKLAANRGLLPGGTTDRLGEREALAAEIRSVVERIDQVERLAG